MDLTALSTHQGNKTVELTCRILLNINITNHYDVLSQGIN